jgi:hypothetical protein
VNEPEIQRLVMGETFIRHCDGFEGVYVGVMLAWGPGSKLVLHVMSDGVRREWYADDCEVAR